MSVETIEVVQISTERLRLMVDEMVDEKLAELFLDSENNLEFTEGLKEILARQDVEIKNGERGELLSDVAARLGLN